jgi:type VI protein secretion system component VasK
MARGKKKAAEQPHSAWPHISVSEHPRARRSLRRLRGWAGLLTFGFVALLSYRAGVAPFEVGVRALAAGIGVYLAAWAAGVALWRQIVYAEAKREAERRREEREEQLRVAEEAKAAAEAEAEAVA